MRAPPFPYDQEEVVPVSSIPHVILPSCPGAGIGCMPGDFGSIRFAPAGRPILARRCRASPGRSGDGSGADNNPRSSGMSPANIGCIDKVIGGLCAGLGARVMRRGCDGAVLYFWEALKS